MSRLGLAVRLGPMTRGSSGPAYALKLDFKNAAYSVGSTNYGSLSAVPGYTYSRSGDKGEVNASGAVQTFLANTPGIPTGVGYWSRGALTNLSIRSQEFDTWTSAGGGSQTANTTIAPDGTTTADTLTGGALNGQKYAYQPTSSTFTAVPHTSSVFVKMGTQRYIQMIFGNASNGTAYANFDLQAGTKTAEGGGGTGYIVPLGNGYYRCVLVATPAAVSDITVGPVFIDIGSALRLDAHTGGATTLIAWQQQVLPGNFPDGGPIIVTGAATASAGADALSVSLANGTYANTVYTYSDGTTETIPTTIAAGLFTVANPKAKAIASITVNP